MPTVLLDAVQACAVASRYPWYRNTSGDRLKREDDMMQSTEILNRGFSSSKTTFWRAQALRATSGCQRDDCAPLGWVDEALARSRTRIADALKVAVSAFYSWKRRGALDPVTTTSPVARNRSMRALCLNCLPGSSCRSRNTALRNAGERRAHIANLGPRELDC